MKKVIFLTAVAAIAFITSCNSDNNSQTSTSDTTTSITPPTVMNDNSNSNLGDTSRMNSGDMNHMDTANGKMNNEMANNSGAADPSTNTFIAKAASGGMMEIELGNMARDKAKSSRVKDFAMMIVNDHTAAANELKSTASSNSIMVPSEMIPEHKMHTEMMKNKTGADFDKAYMSMMVNDHKKDIAEYKKASTSLKNEAIKGFAARTLPVLQKHLDSAQAISKKM